MLAKSSDVFRTMLYERNWGEGAKEEVDLSETPECAAVFDKFLRFLYTAEVSSTNINRINGEGVVLLLISCQ